VLTYVDVSECGMSGVAKGLPSSTRYAQLRRNNISALSRTAFVECPFASIVVLDDNRISSVDPQASVLLIADSSPGRPKTGTLFNCITVMSYIPWTARDVKVPQKLT